MYMSKVPHLVQYQGSKRTIAPKIIQYFPKKFDRLVEPFAGTCAVSILASQEKLCKHFWVNDINEPLIKLMQECVENPMILYEDYSKIWLEQFEQGRNNVDYFYKIRDEFNEGKHDPARMLFILARVVKGAVRYNVKGEMNQSCDKRRNGTKPEIILKNANLISELLRDNTNFTSLDYKEVLAQTKTGDLVYMDPPYQGTSNPNVQRDNRYIKGVDFYEFVQELEKLSQRGVDYIVSYDGMTGEKKIGMDLPENLGLTHLYINAGKSTQATLNGKDEITYESLYLSASIKMECPKYEQMKLVFA